MPAHAIVSHQQMEVLVAFMEENRELATGRQCATGPVAKQRVKTKWEDLASRLNSVGIGTTKTASKWRDYWNEKKYLVRKKAQACIKHARETGGPTKMGSMTLMEERILNILGKVSVFVEASMRIPVDEPSAAPPTESPRPTTDDELLPTPCLPEPLPLRLPSPPPFASPPITTEEPSALRWVQEIEERRVAAEERTADAMASMASAMAVIASALTDIKNTLEHVKEKL